jgi:hypothetical protein
MLHLLVTFSCSFVDLFLIGNYQVFISHSQATGHFMADVIKLRLKMKDPSLRIFLDVDDLSKIHDLKKKVEECRHFILLLTDGALDRPWVKQEIEWAVNSNKNIIPVCIFLLNENSLFS